MKKRKKSMFTSILPIFSLMVVPVYLKLVCGDLDPMTSLQDGELRLFQGETVPCFNYCDR